MVYTELAQDLNLKPNSWVAAIMFSALIGVLSIGIRIVWDILIYQRLELASTLQSGFLFVLLLSLIVKSTMALRANKTAMHIQSATVGPTKSGKVSLSTFKEKKHHK